MLEERYLSLPEPIRELWRKLAVFADNFGAEAAAWVWGTATKESDNAKFDTADGEASVLLKFLYKHRLLRLYYDERYSMSNRARKLAFGKLTTEEEYTSRLAHAHFYLNLLAECEKEYRVENGNLRWIIIRQDNFLDIAAAQKWCAAGNGNEHERLAMAASFPITGFYFLMFEQLREKEWRQWLEDAQRAAKLVNDQENEEKINRWLRFAYEDEGVLSRTTECDEWVLSLARERGIYYQAKSLWRLGWIYEEKGNLARALEFMYACVDLERSIVWADETISDLKLIQNIRDRLSGKKIKQGYDRQALAVARSGGDRQAEADALGDIGNRYLERGEAKTAIGYFEQQLVVTRELLDRRAEAEVLGSLGSAYGNLNDDRKAIEYYEQQLIIYRELDKRQAESSALNNLGLSYEALFDLQKAYEYYDLSLRISKAIDDQSGVAIASWNLGLLYEEQGDLARAVELMQVRADYEYRQYHPDFYRYAAQVEAIRKRLADNA
jgi:tetratricopeptide (TPR) repeat protein